MPKFRFRSKIEFVVEAKNAHEAYDAIVSLSIGDGEMEMFAGLQDIEVDGHKMEATIGMLEDLGEVAD